ETAGPPRRHSAAPRTPPLPVSAAAAEADGESEDESWGCWGASGKRPASPAAEADGEDEAWGASGKRPAAEKESCGAMRGPTPRRIIW
ncbi:unnamed protein product, partial [Prorocentrum cordatum]